MHYTSSSSGNADAVASLVVAKFAASDHTSGNNCQHHLNLKQC